MNEPLAIPEDLRPEYNRLMAVLRECGSRQSALSTAADNIALIGDIARLEADNKRLSADASWAATHRSELADLREAFAKSEAENATLRAQVERLSAPVSDKEYHQWFWETNTPKNTVLTDRSSVSRLIASRLDASRLIASRKGEEAGNG